MGVPGFFKWLYNKYKNKDIIVNDIEVGIDILYIDANCLFHPQCFKIIDAFPKCSDIDKLEEYMITRIKNYLNYIIFMSNPKLVYIAVDGVAPMAKMNQQRKRRFKSVKTTKKENEIKKKHNRFSESYWSNTCITPGTIFMEKLHNALLKFIKNHKKKIIYSSYHTVGEGEHKILQHLKTQEKNGIYTIYGLDADLIFLAMACNYDNIYLLREQIFFDISNEKNDLLKMDPLEDVEEDLTYVSIKTFKNYLNKYFINTITSTSKETFKNKYNFTEVYKNDNFCDDFIILCFLLGNDFIPHLPSIDINNNSLDYIIKTYSIVYNKEKKKLYFDNQLNVKMFIDIIKLLANNENYYFTTILSNSIERQNKMNCRSKDKYEIDMWNFKHLKDINPPQDTIKLGKVEVAEYKYNYYKYHFHDTGNQKDLINNMCVEYFAGISWVIKYYFDECPNYEWQYTFSHGPFLSDLAKTPINIIKNIYFEQSDIIRPLTQLLAVLPPHNYNFLPNSYMYLVQNCESPLIEYYPIDFKIDTLYKTLEWKCDALLPIINIKKIKKHTENLPLTEDEEDRNKILTEFYNY